MFVEAGKWIEKRRRDGVICDWFATQDGCTQYVQCESWKYYRVTRAKGPVDGSPCDGAELRDSVRYFSMPLDTYDEATFGGEKIGEFTAKEHGRLIGVFREPCKSWFVKIEGSLRPFVEVNGRTVVEENNGSWSLLIYDSWIE